MQGLWTPSMFECCVAATSPEILKDSSAQQKRGGSTGHVDALTGLRGFAALVVVFVHGSGLTAYPWLGLHGYGPIALFVLSGFLLIQPFSRWMIGVAERPSIEKFVRRRLYRIFPAYLVVLCVTALILPMSRPLEADGWFRAFTLTNTYGADGLRPGMEHTWSLGTELTWYAALPLIAIAVGTVVRRWWPNRAVPVMVGAFILSLAITVVWRWFITYHVHDFGKQLMFPLWLPGFLACFVGGALLAHTVIAARNDRGSMKALRWFASKSWLVLGVAIGSALLGNSHLGGPWTFEPASFQEVSIRTAACTITALALLAGVAAGDDNSLVNRIFSVRWLVATGRWSYGIYLWHMPAMLLLAREVQIHQGPFGLVVWLAMLLAVAIPLGALTYAFVERPAIAWSKGTPLHLR